MIEASATSDSVILDAAPHLAALQGDGPHDEALSRILESAAAYIGSSSSPFSRDLPPEGEAPACPEAYELAAALRELCWLRLPCDLAFRRTGELER